jgi:hypothetical protein
MTRKIALERVGEIMKAVLEELKLARGEHEMKEG